MTLWGKDKILIYVSILFAALTVKKVYSFVQVNRAYSLRFSPHVSEKFKQNVKQHLKDNLAKVNTANIARDLSVNFGLIKSVVAEKSDPFKCHLRIKSRSPLVRVGDKVLTEDIGIFDLDLFENYSVPILKLNDLEETCYQEFKTFLHNALDEQVFDLYDIEWVTKNYILLRHKENRNLTFLTKHDRVPSQKDVELVENFIGEKKGSKGHARADLRFAGQVVTSFV